MSQYTLDKLSTELLLKIFNYLDIFDLCKLRRTCKRFYDIISSWDNVLLKNIEPIVTNQRSSIFRARCLNQLSAFEKIRISKNWKIGRYREKSLLFVKQKYMPWLYLSNKSVWISRGKKIFSYERNKNNINVNKPSMVLQGSTNADVGNFQLKENLLLSGQRDGSLWLRSLNDTKLIFDMKYCHDSDINSVDISPYGNIIASGSRDNCFKIWRVDYDLNYESLDVLKELHCHMLQDRVLKVSFLNEKPLLAVGTSGNDYINSLFIYDIERISDPIELPSTNYGLGVLDIKWDGPHILWSCGYDSYLKRWDLRTGKCEQIFADPYASTLYCLDYDNYNTIMTGTQLHGRVILWDIRQKNSVQLYFMESCKNRNGRCKGSSPVYSLSFDSEYLFTATDRNLNVLNFSVYNGNVKDYSFFCRQKIIS